MTSRPKQQMSRRRERRSQASAPKRRTGDQGAKLVAVSGCEISPSDRLSLSNLSAEARTTAAPRLLFKSSSGQYYILKIIQVISITQCLLHPAPCLTFLPACPSLPPPLPSRCSLIHLSPHSITVPRLLSSPSRVISHLLASFNPFYLDSARRLETLTLH